MSDQREWMVLFPADREDAWAAASEDERQVTHDADGEFVRLLGERGGRVVGGAELAPADQARVVRRGGGGPLVTQGPYAESVEQLSGFYLVRIDDESALLEAVVALLAGHPAVEVRPVVSDD
ncbi:YciI family protein [Nocardioides litoris]|uniref:YciI family protein n=1 Tax=Nocardioides litoris TaxID=1926648 RepID=UPI001B88014E|nr:YciI family protein [Nocardioides litoris]